MANTLLPLTGNSLWICCSSIIGVIALYISLTGCGLALLTISVFAVLATFCQWLPNLTNLIMLVLALAATPLVHQSQRWYKDATVHWQETIRLINQPLITDYNQNSKITTQLMLAPLEALSVTPPTIVPTKALSVSSPTVVPTKPPNSTSSSFGSSLLTSITTFHRVTQPVRHDPDELVIMREGSKKWHASASWSKNQWGKFVDPIIVSEPQAAALPLPLWERESGDAGITGVFRHIHVACEGSPDVKQLAASSRPDQQRRQRIASFVELLQRSPLVSADSVDEGGAVRVGELEDDWGAAVFVGALMGVSQDEFTKLSRMVTRSKLMEKLTPGEGEKLIGVAEEIARLAAAHPVQRNSTFDFIVSGQPIQKAPVTLLKMLDLLKTTARSSSGSSSASLRALIDQREIDVSVRSQINPAAEQYTRILRTRRVTLLISLVVLTGWVILSGHQVLGNL